MLKDAFALHSQGKFAEAERAYAEILRQQPGHFQALYLSGVLALQRGHTMRGMELLQESLKREPRQPLAHRDLGNALQQMQRFAEALASYDKSLALKPDQSDLYNNRGIALTSLGRFDEALESYGRAITLKPDYAQAYNNRGTVLSGRGRAAEALADFSKAIALDPNYVKAITNRASVLAALGRHDEALKDCDRAIALNPTNADPHHQRGNVLIGQARADAALESFDRALALDPGLSSAHTGRGTALAMLGRPQDALGAHERAVALDPNSAIAHTNRGAVLARLQRHYEALEAHDRALVLDPQSALAHSNRGTALGLLDRPEEGLASLDRALTIQPDLTQAHINRGNFLIDLKRHDDALESFDRAIALNPDTADAHFGKAQTLLARGQYKDAWPVYEWRKRRVAPDAFHGGGRPEWTGQEDIAGKILFIEAEQGLGDTIQFCRFAKLAADRRARVILMVQKSLMGLLQTLDPRIEIVSAPPSVFDYYIPLLSLPLAFGTEVAAIPAATPYLHAEPALAGRMRERIGSIGLKIGLCWQGSYIAGTRSFPLRALENIARLPGVRLISLQKGAGTEQLDALPDGMRVETLGNDFPQDFGDTAATMDAMDLIISCDTSVAHLAGALGRATWVALPYAADWRWLLDREDSPWYPGMQLFRQPKRGDWSGLFEKIRENLAAIVARKSTGGKFN